MRTPDDERRRQLSGALALLQNGLDHASRRVEEMHIAIARKPFDAMRNIPVIGAHAKAVEHIHDGITHGVHETLRAVSALTLGTAVKLLDEPQESRPGKPK
jgi:hypothetical protein